MAGKKMADKQRMDEQRELTDEELEQQEAAELPDRARPRWSTRISRPRSTWPRR
jgi:hypothetical protein